MFYQAGYSAGSSDTMAMAIGFAIILHAALIFGINFSNDDEKPRMENIEVILVQQSSEEMPKEVDFLAQTNLEGGGESETVERPATPFVAPNPEQSPEIVTPASAPFEPMTHRPQLSVGTVKAEMPPVQEPEKEKEEKKPVVEQDELIATEVEKIAKIQKPEPEKKPSPESKPVKDPEPIATPEPKPENPSAEELMSRSLAMASLSAEIDRRLEAKAKRPRKDFISASTREYKYAAYMEAWRAKVERIGNLNYPEEARRKKISGTLRMTVALNADGTIHEISLDKSSGRKVLDDAAIRIVRLAAPFAPFPENISKDVDILYITRTWKFLHNSTFSGR